MRKHDRALRSPFVPCQQQWNIIERVKGMQLRDRRAQGPLFPGWGMGIEHAVASQHSTVNGTVTCQVLANFVAHR